ncbi:hypothetical protein [Streptomyces sp. NPDC026092]|uniref:hypothetical protein n=1 Tax=Streptomyces sp. NPDC026092 TaxID=3154797 RepID=UPI0033E8321B
MDSGVMAALIAAGGALIGVIVGWVGPIIAARTQARAAHAQADAALASAEHVTAGQHRTVMDQQARQARRDVYSRFQEAILAFEGNVARARRDGTEWVGGDGGTTTAAFAQVMVEGPDEVEQAAKEVKTAMGAVIYAHHITTLVTEDLARLHEGDPTWDDRQRALAGTLISALAANETAYRAVSSSVVGDCDDWFQWRYEVNVGLVQANHTGRKLQAAWERAGRPMPPADLAAAYDVALTRAVNAYVEASRELHLRSPVDLLARRGTLQQGAALKSVTAAGRFDLAKSAFRLAARRVLHDA